MADLPRAVELQALLRRGVLCITCIACSVCMVRFNKYLMHEGRFPHAFALAAVHTGLATALSLALFLVCPWMFPAVPVVRMRAPQVMWNMVAIGAMFSIGVVASTKAYLYSGVALLQFMKEGNIFLAFMMSCFAGLQQPTTTRVLVLVWIVGSAALAGRGDMHLSAVGIGLQLVAQVAEATRFVLSEFMLKGRGFKLDPLTFTLLSAPVCFAGLTFGAVLTLDTEVGIAFCAWWRPILISGVLAFALNIVNAMLLRELSVVGLFMCGLVKDFSLVALSSAFFGESVVGLQWVAFGSAMCGVCAWCWINTWPEEQPCKRSKAELQEEHTPLFVGKFVAAPRSHAV